MMLGRREEFFYHECLSCGTFQIEDIPDLAAYYPKNYYSLKKSKPKFILLFLRSYFYRIFGRFLKSDSGWFVPGVRFWLSNLKASKNTRFLDVGGGATKEKVTAAFKIITADPNVQGILVNIFGGIMKCDVIAECVIAAVKEVGLTVPLVVRLEGTNVQLGKDIISKSGLNVIAADDLDDAAQKIVKAVRDAR
jgi:hypothetical protein